MDQKRFFAFIALSLTIVVGWNGFILPRFMPKPKPAAQDEAADKAIANKPAEGAADKADSVSPAEGETPEKPAVGGEVAQPSEKPVAGDEPAPADKPAQRVEHPLQTIVLGSPDFDSGYRQLVTLTSRGAAVLDVTFNDPRYLTLHKPHKQLRVIEETELGPLGPTTLGIGVPQLSADVGLLNWELVEVSPAEIPHSSALFRIRLDDLQIDKRFELVKVDNADPLRGEAQAYTMKVDMTFTNLSRKDRTINYVLQGPVGLPLENADNASKFRDVVAGFLKDGGAVDNQVMTAKTIADGKGEEWKNPVKYIGVDVQFFAALLLPAGDQSVSAYTRSIKQELVGSNQKEKSEVSVRITSVDLNLKATGAESDAHLATHSYTLFTGPKRDDVLPAGTEKVIDFGSIFGMAPSFQAFICRRLLSVLHFFHHLTGSWGLAVIGLTICVRGAMFPISIKQARSAAKMQLIQPELAALKEKYGKDKEKFAREQMELFRKHNHNPFGGCL
ncbi:MAG: membrane protein insertase YidC, partial [Planctomycetes bacterium]|nr:membrane protein insertase YidC [Planctomycetota bacterium]